MESTYLNPRAVPFLKYSDLVPGLKIRLIIDRRVR